MKNTTLQNKTIWALSCLAYLSPWTGAVASNPKPSFVAKQVGIGENLVTLFKHNKGTKNQKTITALQPNLAAQIGTLLHKEYDKNALQKVLGNTNPTPTDEHIFQTLQWAYQEGTSKNIVDKVKGDNEEVGSRLCAVLSAWRKGGAKDSVKSQIQKMKQQLPDKLYPLVSNEQAVSEQAFKQQLSYDASSKDIIFIKTLQWAYQAGANLTYTMPPAKDTSESPKNDAEDSDASEPTPTPYKEPKVFQGKDVTQQTTPWVYILLGSSFVIILGRQAYGKVYRQKLSKRRKKKSTYTYPNPRRS